MAANADSKMPISIPTDGGRVGATGRRGGACARVVVERALVMPFSLTLKCSLSRTYDGQMSVLVKRA